ncbi:hypothetical protein [Flavobacterium caeni]|uniref:Uncharacterized protein n=1 Tax=Flavobacterium caeni TaxID=490189 RepID=A0A1G5JIE5_9FLAO|nr:hypothetical protein [Flavobacterium caeni]SCY88126.1 hypothetical protein SAMN02927903_02732 [Flavobacterium caeni]
MKNRKPTLPDELSHLGFLPLNDSEERLLDVYWHKKELEEFLPQIATYASPKELTAITLSQLAIMEKQIVNILQMMSETRR